MMRGTFGERIHPNASAEFQRETTAFWERGEDRRRTVAWVDADWTAIGVDHARGKDQSALGVWWTTTGKHLVNERVLVERRTDDTADALRYACDALTGSGGVPVADRLDSVLPRSSDRPVGPFMVTADRLLGDALVWHHARKGSTLQQLRDAAKANEVPGRPASIALTPTETAQAIWADQDRGLLGAAGLSLKLQALQALQEEAERLRLTDHERDLLRRGGVATARKLWTERTGGDTETWAEAQGHAWRVLRRDDGLGV